MEEHEELRLTERLPASWQRVSKTKTKANTKRQRQKRKSYLLLGSECLSKLSAAVTTFSSTNFTFFKEPIPQVTTGGLYDGDGDDDDDDDQNDDDQNGYDDDDENDDDDDDDTSADCPHLRRSYVQSFRR